MEEIRFMPIGYIHSPYKSKEESPRQKYLHPGGGSFNRYYARIQPWSIASGAPFPYYRPISFHLSHGFELLVKRPGGTGSESRSIHTRSPHRPNGIGLSIVELLKLKVPG